MLYIVCFIIIVFLACMFFKSEIDFAECAVKLEKMTVDNDQLARHILALEVENRKMRERIHGNPIGLRPLNQNKEDNQEGQAVS